MNDKRLLSVHRLHYRKGGAEAVHLDHLELFRERGWTCAEFAAQNQANEPSDFSAYFPSPFDENATGIFGMARQVPRFIYNREARDKFALLLDDFKPDIVHCHGFYHHLTPSIIQPALERGIPFVYTLHDFKLICPTYHFYSSERGVCEKCSGGRQWNCLTHRCTRQSLAKDAIFTAEGLAQWYLFDVLGKISAFVGPSRFIVDKFVAQGVDEARVRTIPNFFETTDDAPVSDADIAEAKARYGDYALFFGRMSQEKGVDRLIRAAAASGVKLVIAGDGPAANDLREFAAGSPADIEFTGHQSGARLWALVQGARCIALPSICYENAPKSILEAQARGKVVICTDIGGLPELVEHGKTGFLVPPDDVEALGQTLLQVMNLADDELAVIGEAASLRTRSAFTRDLYFEKMSTLYQDLMRT